MFQALLTIPPLLVAVILHEIAHGYVAERLGDPTARRLGRITLNPIKHIDPFLTILVPGVLIMSGSPIIFGGAKPVPIDTRYLKNPRRDMVYIAIAGPIVNFALAFLSYLILMTPKIDTLLIAALPSTIAGVVYSWFIYAVLINIVLGVFNLFPIPPLDGGRIAVGLLPLRFARPLANVERYGFLIVIGLIYLGALDVVLRPILEFTIKSLPIN